MILFKKASQLNAYLRKASTQGKKIGFVPTMGALHPGHISLLKAARQGSDLIVASIFVNPAQFNDPEDFQKYPVTLEKDLELLEKAGCDLLFLPSVEEIYPAGTGALVHFDLGSLEDLLEGPSRPGHFQGVCNVMSRLLAIISPDQLYMGQKDYQQCLVVKRLIALLGIRLNFQICPTLREPDGLAMSSRNLRLTGEQRASAPAIYNRLEFIRDHFRTDPIKSLLDKSRQYLLDTGFSEVDYLVIARADNLEPVDFSDPHTPLLALVAAIMGGIRLLDNMILQ
jgi:pantoate--beta-alanine ligase